MTHGCNLNVSVGAGQFSLRIATPILIIIWPRSPIAKILYCYLSCKLHFGVKAVIRNKEYSETKSNKERNINIKYKHCCIRVSNLPIVTQSLIVSYLKQQFFLIQTLIVPFIFCPIYGHRTTICLQVKRGLRLLKGSRKS